MQQHEASGIVGRTGDAAATVVWLWYLRPSNPPCLLRRLSPPLDAVSQQAIEDQVPYPERTVAPPDPGAMTTDGGGDGPDTVLWLALMLAAEDGTTVPDLMTATGRWLLDRQRRSPCEVGGG